MYGAQLRALGEHKAKQVMARAMNYEGRKAFTAVKRALRVQTSIKYSAINQSVKFMKSSARGATLETAIVGRGNYLTLKYFSPKQLKSGVSAKVWGKRQRFKGAFGAPGSPAAAKLHGTPHKRIGKKRFPIKPLYGPNLAIEMVRDNPPKVFLVSSEQIAARIAAEIAAVLRILNSGKRRDLR
jgi:hypothetical protein